MTTEQAIQCLINEKAKELGIEDQFDVRHEVEVSESLSYPDTHRIEVESNRGELVFFDDGLVYIWGSRELPTTIESDDDIQSAIAYLQLVKQLRHEIARHLQRLSPMTNDDD